MTSTRHANGQKSKSPEELRREVEQARAALGETVGELAAKTDMKAAARQKKAELKERARLAAEKGRQNRGTVIGATAGVVGAAGLAAVTVMMLKRRRGGGTELRMPQAAGKRQAPLSRARLQQLRGQARKPQARMQQLRMKRHGKKAIGIKLPGVKSPGLKRRGSGPFGTGRRKGVRGRWARSFTNC